VAYENLRAQPIEEVLNSVQDLATVASRDQVQSVMALVARCTIEVGDRLAQLSADIHQAQKILGTRLSELNAELERSRSEMARASEIAAERTAALVRWTKVLVFVTAAYAILTGGLLLVAAFGSPWLSR